MINKQKISINYSITETEIIKRRRLKERPASFSNGIIHKKTSLFLKFFLVIRKKMIIWKASDMGFLIYQFITSNRPLKMKFFYLWGKRGLLEFWPRPTPSRGQIKVDIWKVITGLNPVSYTSTYAGASETSVRCACSTPHPLSSTAALSSCREQNSLESARLASVYTVNRPSTEWLSLRRNINSYNSYKTVQLEFKAKRATMNC